eukprot:scaffold15412_cov20-Tisochrysis_lutea.AAC.2
MWDPSLAASRTDIKKQTHFETFKGALTSSYAQQLLCKPGSSISNLLPNPRQRTAKGTSNGL